MCPPREGDIQGRRFQTAHTQKEERRILEKKRKTGKSSQFSCHGRKPASALLQGGKKVLLKRLSFVRIAVALSLNHGTYRGKKKVERIQRLSREC